MTLGQRILTIRTDCDESQDEFAASIGKRRADVSMYENDKAKPTIPALIKIAEKGYSLNWIVLEVGEMKLSSSANADESHRIREESLTEAEASAMRTLQIIRELRRIN